MPVIKQLKQRWIARYRGAGADLRGARLSRIRLYRARLSGANLSEAILYAAKLMSADLSRANLDGACLADAYLRAANLRGASLRGANLEGADLIRANLQDAALAGANLTNALYSTGTHWPDRFSPQQHGARLMDTFDPDTFERVKKVLMTVLRVREDQVTLTAALVDDLGFTDQEMELALSLEEEFDIEIPDEDAERLVTVEEIITHVLLRRQAGDAAE